jgi:hypothetical protein
MRKLNNLFLLLVLEKEGGGGGKSLFQVIKESEAVSGLAWPAPKRSLVVCPGCVRFFWLVLFHREKKDKTRGSEEEKHRINQLRGRE